jgi:hypothetical protein
LPQLKTEIVKHFGQAKGFVVLSKRGINDGSARSPRGHHPPGFKPGVHRCRGLAKDWENLKHKALAFRRLASVRLTLRKLRNPS